jgi:hypothetical protein
MKVVNVEKKADLTVSFQIKYDEFGISPKMSIFIDDFPLVEGRLIPFLKGYGGMISPRWCDLNDSIAWALDRLLLGYSLNMDKYYVHVVETTPKGFVSSGLSDCPVFVACWNSSKAVETAKRRKIDWDGSQQVHIGLGYQNIIEPDENGQNGGLSSIQICGGDRWQGFEGFEGEDICEFMKRIGVRYTKNEEISDGCIYSIFEVRGNHGQPSPSFNVVFDKK